MSKSKKLLVNWIKSQPELDYLRKLACETKIVYNKNSILINQYGEKQLSFIQESLSF